MTPGSIDSEGPLSIYLGMGVGTYKYSDQYPPLKQPVPEVTDLGKILGQDNYETYILKDLDDVSFIAPLRGVLQADKLRRGGFLVILWSGHGEPAAQGGLYLVDKDKAPRNVAIGPSGIPDFRRPGARRVKRAPKGHFKLFARLSWGTSARSDRGPTPTTTILWARRLPTRVLNDKGRLLQ